MWAVLDYTNTRSVSRELLLCKVSILGPDYFEDQLANRSPGAFHASATYTGAGAHQELEEGTPQAELAQRAAQAAANANPYAQAHEDEQHSRSQPQHIHPAFITPSEALRQKHTHLQAIEMLTRQFNGIISDVSNDCVIIEMSGKKDKVDTFLRLVRPYGILEAARTGE